MNILFTKNEASHRNQYSREFTEELLKFLSPRHHLMVTGSARSSSIAKSKQKKISIDQCDVMMVHDTSSLKRVVKSAEKYSIPVIFFSYSSDWTSQPFLFKGLLKVFSFHQGRVNTVPEELIHTFDRPVLGRPVKKIKRREDPGDVAVVKAVHFHQSADHDLGLLKSIIAFVNVNLKLHLTIVIDNALVDLIQPLVNFNITLVFRENFYNAPGMFQLAITSGSDAVGCLYDDIPVMIVGSHGIGGILSRRELQDHLENGFRGRIGGEAGEQIPFWMLHHQLQAFLANRQRIEEETASIGADLRHRFNAQHVFRQVERQMVSAISGRKAVFSKRYHKLKPSLGNGVRLVNDVQRNMCHVLRSSNKIVASIPSDINNVFDQFNGERSLTQIAADNRLDITDIGELAKELWDQKLVFFER